MFANWSATTIGNDMGEILCGRPAGRVGNDLTRRAARAIATIATIATIDAHALPTRHNSVRTCHSSGKSTTSRTLRR